MKDWNVKNYISKEIKISEEAKDLLQRMLEIDPKKRITLEQAQKHTWIANESFYHEKEFVKKMTSTMENMNKDFS